MCKKIINFSIIGDERGNLISLEEMRNIPFQIKRVYYLYELQEELPRGFHAHKDLQQVLICVKGSCSVLLDDGKDKETYNLNQPNKGLFVDRMIWHEMYDFSSDCVLMILASEHYNEEDYIRDYTTYKEILYND